MKMLSFINNNQRWHKQGQEQAQAQPEMVRPAVITRCPAATEGKDNLMSS
jgi:hypothetical protein